MCAKACLDNEECRYDKENCEYKCHNPHSSKIVIWASIVAVAGPVIIVLLIFIVVRHFKNKAQIKNTIDVEKQPDYEVPYKNESVNIENEETYEAYQSAEYETYDEMYAEPYADNKN